MQFEKALIYNVPVQLVYAATRCGQDDEHAT